MWFRCATIRGLSSIRPSVKPLLVSTLNRHADLLADLDYAVRTGHIKGHDPNGIQDGNDGRAAGWRSGPSDPESDRVVTSVSTSSTSG